LASFGAMVGCNTPPEDLIDRIPATEVEAGRAAEARRAEARRRIGILLGEAAKAPVSAP
jgi:hypothetical protein